jgi:hypothetical membrane protein
MGAVGERDVGFVLVGGFWALFGLGMLITGSGSINLGVIIFLSKRQARIAGAATMVLGLIIVSIGIFPRPEWFEPREVALGGFFVFFVVVAVLATIMSAVQLVRWARDGEGAGEVRKRAYTVALVLVFQTAFLVFVGVMFTTL